MVETMKSNNMNNEQKKEDELHLEWEPVQFTPFGKITRVTSKELAIMIRRQFEQTFHDVVGCYIEPWFNKDKNEVMFKVKLYFEYNANEVPEGKIRNLNKIVTTGTNSIKEAMRNLSNISKGRTYELNDKTKELLSDFMYGGRHAKRDWNALVQEKKEPVGIGDIYSRGAEKILVEVTGFDLNVICRALYGSRAITEVAKEDGKYVAQTSNAIYKCRFHSYLPDGTFTLNIDQINTDKVIAITMTENPQVARYYSVRMY